MSRIISRRTFLKGLTAGTVLVGWQNQMRKGEEKMSRENVKIIQAVYDAFSRGDLQTVFSIFDPDIEFHQSQEVPWGGHYKGLTEVQEFLGKLRTAIESRVEPEFVDAGDCVVAVGHSKGKVRATGREFNVRAVHVWTLKDGKVIRWESYIDNPKMLSALQSASS